MSKLPCVPSPRIFLGHLSACLVVDRKDTETDKLWTLTFGNSEFSLPENFQGPEEPCLILPPYFTCASAGAQGVK